MSATLSITVPTYESDFDGNKSLKLARAMEFIQDVATLHSESIGCGWDELNAQDMLWILCKTKLRYCRKIDKTVKSIKLVTTPQQPERLFAERQCYAEDKDGNRLFESVSLWMVIRKSDRKILPVARLDNYTKGVFGGNTVKIDDKFCKVICDESFLPAYDFTVRYSMLDTNGHVNNTRYVTFAEDALKNHTDYNQVEIVFSRELKEGAQVSVKVKEENGVAQVVGISGGEQCFSARFTK